MRAIAAGLHELPQGSRAHHANQWMLPAAILLVVFGILCERAWHHLSKHDASAFLTYYNAASEMSADRSPYGPINGYPYIYPPLYAWACLPLAHLPYLVAERVMLIFDGAVLLAALLVGARAMLNRFGDRHDSAATLWVALITALIAIGPIFRELRAEQVNCLLLLGFALGLYWLDDHPILAGATLAIAISIKYLPAIAIPYLLLRRRWSAAGAAVAGTAVVPMIPATTLGWSMNLHYLTLAYSGLAHALGAAPVANAAQMHPLSDPLNVSISSAIARLAVSRGWPAAIGAGITAVVLAVSIGALIRLYRRNRMPLFSWPAPDAQKEAPFRRLIAVEWAGLVIAVIAFSPNGELILAALPAAVVAALLSGSNSPARSLSLLSLGCATTVALLLPIAAMGHGGSASWNAAGASSFALLLIYLSTSAIALRPANGDYQRRKLPYASVNC